MSLLGEQAVVGRFDFTNSALSEGLVQDISSMPVSEGVVVACRLEGAEAASQCRAEGIALPLGDLVCGTFGRSYI